MYQQSSDQNVGKMEIPKMTIQRPVFCKRPIYTTLICNHKSAISAYSGHRKN